MSDKNKIEMPPEGQDEVLFPAADSVVDAPAVVKSSTKTRQYTHLNCGTTHEMSEEDYSDMVTNPDRWNSLLCAHCGPGGFRIGKDGEMVWAGSKEKVIPEDVPA